MNWNDLIVFSTLSTALLWKNNKNRKQFCLDYLGNDIKHQKESVQVYWISKLEKRLNEILEEERLK